MKIYLAGPMTGIQDHNFPVFHAEAKRLRALGYEVVNPAELVTDQTKPWVDCMRIDIPQLLKCDTVAVLPGWTASKGARLEHRIALELGMNPRLAAFFVDRVPVTDLCTRCGGAHRLSQCSWPLTEQQDPMSEREAFEAQPALAHLDFTWSEVRDDYLSYSTRHAFAGFLVARALPARPVVEREGQEA